jgi:hypothetical protein
LILDFHKMSKSLYENDGGTTKNIYPTSVNGLKVASVVLSGANNTISSQKGNITVTSGADVAGVFTLSWTALATAPVVVATPVYANDDGYAVVRSVTTSGCVIVTAPVSTAPTPSRAAALHVIIQGL